LKQKDEEESNNNGCERSSAQQSLVSQFLAQTVEGRVPKTFFFKKLNPIALFMC